MGHPIILILAVLLTISIFINLYLHNTKTKTLERIVYKDREVKVVDNSVSFNIEMVNNLYRNNWKYYKVINDSIQEFTLENIILNTCNNTFLIGEQVDFTNLEMEYQRFEEDRRLTDYFRYCNTAYHLLSPNDVRFEIKTDFLRKSNDVVRYRKIYDFKFENMYFSQEEAQEILKQQLIAKQEQINAEFEIKQQKLLEEQIEMNKKLIDKIYS